MIYTIIALVLQNTPSFTTIYHGVECFNFSSLYTVLARPKKQTRQNH